MAAAVSASDLVTTDPAGSTDDEWDEYVRNIVAEWPPLTAEQCERLTVLLSPAPTSWPELAA